MKRFQGLRGYPLDLFLVLSAEFIKEMLGQQGNVFFSVPQGRHGDLDDIQAVI